MSDLGLKIIGSVVAGLIGMLGYMSVELATLKANLQEEKGRSEEIDENQKAHIKENTISLDKTRESVIRLNTIYEIKKSNECKK